VEGLVRRPDPQFWAARRVLLTGHTGFKGAWASRMLAMLGAQVTGFALAPAPGPSTFEALGAAGDLAADLRGDLRDADAVARAVDRADILLHLAAQAIVSEGYRDPVGTWGTNVTGTLHLLQALRGSGVQAAVIVTTDKVYRNVLPRAFVETDALGGDDPYSASKAACEVLVESHCASFADLPPIATARAGNVIGGGDFGRDRLFPDLIRAQLAGQPLAVRNPDATRPFQHVLDVIAGYLLLSEAVATGKAPSAVNFGPTEAELSVRDMLAEWGRATGTHPHWRAMEAAPMAEKPRLALDSTLGRSTLGWSHQLTTRAAVAATAEWYAAWAAGQDMAPATDATIRTYLEVP
jgi:CDP-glucose 4,6-dehydratase